MSYITTYTGKHFDPIEVDETFIDIVDIAHALSLICRGNGHSKFFYSVAQHSIACCKEAMLRNYSVRVQLGCLLHDASEAYLSDVTRPIKKELTRYLEVEDILQTTIWNHYLKEPLNNEEIKQIFEIDDDMLSLEFKQFMANSINDNYKNIKLKKKCKFEDMNKVEKEFISLLNTLEDELWQK